MENNKRKRCCSIIRIVFSVHESISKSLKIDNDYYTKKYKRLNKKKVLLIISESLTGFASTINSSSLATLNPSAGITISSSTAVKIFGHFNHK